MWLRHGTSMCGNTLKTGMTSLSGSKSLRRVWAALFAQLLGWWNHPGVSSELVERFLIWLGFVHQRFFDQISAHYLPVLGIQGIGQVPIFATTWTSFPAPTGNVQIDGKHRSFDRWKTGSLELFLVEFGLQKDLSTRHVIVLVLWFLFFRFLMQIYSRLSWTRYQKGTTLPRKIDLHFGLKDMQANKGEL